MKIAFNTRMLLKSRLEGIGNFTLQATKRIVAAHPEHEFIFIFDRPYEEEFITGINVTPIVAFPPARHPFLTGYWNEFAVGNVLKKNKVDLYVGTDGFFPLHTKSKTLSVFHDICFIHHPKDLPFFTGLYYRNMFPHLAKRSTRIAAVSEFTKSDIVKEFNIKSEKIDIVYNGASENFVPLSKSEIEKTRSKFSNGKPYFLFVGAIHHRKNISNMLKAFDEYKKSQSSDVKMLMVGAKRWWTEEMENTLTNMEFKDEVVFTGRVSLQDLTDITGSAMAMTYVSNFEGFGIPIIEAMRSGIPVLTSNTSSMPEIAGGAALLCDPFSVESIKIGMTKLASDENLRADMVQKGLIRQADFNWDKTAAKLWSAIEKTIQ